MRGAATLGIVVTALLAGCSGPTNDERGPVEIFPPDSVDDMALTFDGVDDYASTGTAGFPFPRVPHTVSFWLQTAGGAADQVVMTLRKDTASGVRIGLCDGAVCARSVYSDDAYAVAAEPLPLDAWHHVAYEFDGSGNSPHHTIYVDGAVAATGTIQPNNRTPTSGFVGSTDGTELFFAGQLDELRVWSVARTPAQLAAEIAGDAPDQEPPDLVLFYTFNEASGARVIDRSGRGNHALLGDGDGQRSPRRVASQLPRP